MVVQWMTINLMAHFKRERICSGGGHASSHAPIRTCSAENVRIFPTQRHIHLMCLSHNQAYHTNLIYIGKWRHDQLQYEENAEGFMWCKKVPTASQTSTTQFYRLLLDKNIWQNVNHACLYMIHAIVQPLNIHVVIKHLPKATKEIATSIM